MKLAVYLLNVGVLSNVMSKEDSATLMQLLEKYFPQLRVYQIEE